MAYPVQLIERLDIVESGTFLQIHFGLQDSIGVVIGNFLHLIFYKVLRAWTILQNGLYNENRNDQEFSIAQQWIDIVQQQRMKQFQFQKSKLCLKQQMWIPEDDPLTHLLPPNMDLSHQNKAHDLEQLLASKEEEIELLVEKNNELIQLMNRKEGERARVANKYEELILMYEQVKKNGVTRSHEVKIMELESQNKDLCDRIMVLEREIVDVQNDLASRVKFYEEKNEDSRKLLEKLNQNITKREQKFKEELHQMSDEIKLKNSEMAEMRSRYEDLLGSYHDKEDELTKVMQETQRDRSAFSENVHNLESKLSEENEKLRAKNSHLESLVSKLEEERNLDQSLLRNTILTLRDEKEALSSSENHLKEQLEDISNNYNYLELEFRKMEGKNKVDEAENATLTQQLHLKKQEITKISHKAEGLETELLSLKQEREYLKKENKRIEEHSLELEADLKSYQSDASQYKQLLKEQTSKGNDLEREIRRKETEAQRTSQQMTQLEKERKAFKDKMQRQQAKISNLQHLLNDYKDEKIKIRLEMERKWKEMASFYEKQISKLESRLSEHQTNSTHSIIKNEEVSYFRHSGYNYE